MGLTGMKYGFPVSFYREQTIFGKIEGQHIWVLSRNSIFFKTPNFFVEHRNDYPGQNMGLTWMKYNFWAVFITNKDFQ
jgi:hypothetical protein